MDKYILLLDDEAVCIQSSGKNAGTKGEIEDLRERMGGDFPDLIYRMYKLVEAKS